MIHFFNNLYPSVNHSSESYLNIKSQIVVLKVTT